MKPMTPLRITAALALAGTTLLASTPSTRASGSRPLKFSDFGGVSNAQDMPHSSVGGAGYTHAIELNFYSSKVVLFAHKFPGYASLAVAVGVPDDVAAGSTRELVVTVDGKKVRDITKTYGQPATTISIPLGGATSVAFTDASGDGIILANATLLPAGSPASGSAPVGGASHTLTLGDFGGVSNAANAPHGSVGGNSYAHAIELNFYSSKVVLFAHKFPGYASFSFAVGVPDDVAADSTRELVVAVDGKTVKDITKTYGQPATTITIPLGGVTSIALTDASGDGIILANPTLRR
jgi:hypothetical protein